MVPSTRILIIDDEFHIGDSCIQALSSNGYAAEWADSSKKGLELIDRYSYDMIILDLNMPDIHGIDVLKKIKHQDPDAMVIILTGYGTVQTAVDAMKLGAYDFLSKPFTPQEIRAAVRRGVEQKRLSRENIFLKQELERQRRAATLIGDSKVMARVKEIITLVAPTDSTVLITGPSGTGKGLAARLIHGFSQRSNAPFISVDCGSLVPTLFESELFGHVRGAFTGAEQSKMGKLEMGQGGTVFFDEISNISLEMQAKLLKAVEERKFSRVGSHREIDADVRIMAATNSDIRSEIDRGRFREDLYYRLNVVSIDMPPLRDRMSDLSNLIAHFLKEHGERSDGRFLTVSPKAMEILTSHNWPGNVRELENAVKRLAVLCRSDEIRPSDIYFAGVALDKGVDRDSLTLDDAECRHIRKVLTLFGGHRSKTSAALGIDRKTLREKIRKCRLESVPD
ncbi:MAG: sigma-54-dependent Fis family transcriptional regulator [Deltaproteobacteria bacterium]|nr:sigma-54-dependent Fis family transcriptional regulator [Deltaproteobacteria bacterium]